ncbi:MAG: choice-of-anchor D domain-containing protein, partial [bacterium]
NDPDESVVRVPAHLQVTGKAQIVVTPDSIDFGVTFIGTSQTDTLKVKNIGSDLLIVSSITTSDTVFSAAPTNFSVNPGGEQTVLVSFTPSDTGSVTGDLTITSNDSDKNTINVLLVGEGVFHPSITVSPDSFNVTLVEGDSTTQSMTIGNTGNGFLNWNITIQNSNPASSRVSSKKASGNNSDSFRSTIHKESMSGAIDFISVTPTSGVIAPGDTLEVIVKINTKNLVAGTYGASILIINDDPFNNPKVIPVRLTVTSEQTVSLSLNQDWNLVSWNVNTEVDSTHLLLQDILNNLTIALGFDQIGLTFDPSLQPQFNTLNTLDHLHGYWLKMTGIDTLKLTGISLISQTPIDLQAGWNLISYLPNAPDSTTHALSTVLDKTIVVLGFDGVGLTFDPTIPTEFNTLQTMHPGSGYWIKTTDNATLIYPPSSSGTKQPAKTTNERQRTSLQNSRIVATKEWISIWGDNIVLNGEPLAVGAVLRAVDKEGVLCGECVVKEKGKFGLMPIYKDDPRTQMDEGPKQGEEVFLLIGDLKSTKGIQWTSFGGVIKISSDDLGTVTKIDKGNQSIPKDFALLQNYPNPFNPTTKIRYDLPKRAKVTLKIYDILGSEVATLVDSEQEAGYHSVDWDGRNSAGVAAASGIYFYRLTANEYKKTLKMTLIK